MEYLLRTTVTGGYNGGARISIYLDDELMFTATGSSPYNLIYTPSSGEIEFLPGVINITIIPPANSTDLLHVQYSGYIELTLDINHLGNNTSWGYDYSNEYTIQYEPVIPGIEIMLYQNNSEKNKLNKDLIDELVFHGTLKNETSISNPVFMLEIENPVSYNYAYIPSFNRYYFISDMVSVRKNLWRLHLSVDVLMSFKDYILNVPVILSDTETTGSEFYLSGNVWKSKVKELTDIINFPSGLNQNGEFILITAGG